MELPKNNVVNLPNKSNAPTTKAPMPQSVCGGLRSPYLVIYTGKNPFENTL
jgi:hypothetical protein